MDTVVRPLLQWIRGQRGPVVFSRLRPLFPMILSVTPEVQLRLPEEGNAVELFQAVDTNRAYLREWLPWLDSQKTEHDTHEFIRVVREQFRNNESLTLAVWYRTSLAGVIAYHRFDWLNKTSMIGYWLSKEHQGKGIMTAACRAMVDFGFGRLLLHRVEIKCATENKKSRAIPERLGFAVEGVARHGEWLYDRYVDLVIYSMLAPDWKKSQH